MQPATFTIAVLVLLLTPGPTNTLLAAGSALSGSRNALQLVAAELLGYACGIAVLRVIFLPFESSPLLGVGLRLVCALYLAFLALQLWARGPAVGASPISFRRVFITTFFNPKGMLFAFVLLPPPDAGRIMIVYSLALLLLIAAAGTFWILLGGVFYREHDARSAMLMRRISSATVATFSILLFANAVGASLGA